MRIFFVAAVAALLSSCSDRGPAPNSHAPKALGHIAERIAPPTEQQIEDFGELANYVGLTMTGAPTGEGAETFNDVQKWEWALGGSAILIRHAFKDGSYGGNTYVYKDPKTNSLTYVYVTNSGFHTVGEMRTTEGGWVAEEDVSGQGDVTRIRSTAKLNDDMSTSMTSEYLKAGEWVPGHAFEYKPTNDLLPALKPK